MCTPAHAWTLCGHIQSPRNAFEANLNHTQAQNAVISTCAVTPHQTMHTTPNHTQLSAVYPHAPNTNELRLLCQHGGHIRINQNDQNYYQNSITKIRTREGGGTSCTAQNPSPISSDPPAPLTRCWVRVVVHTRRAQMVSRLHSRVDKKAWVGAVEGGRGRDGTSGFTLEADLQK